MAIGTQAVTSMLDNPNSLCLFQKCRDLEKGFGTRFTDKVLANADTVVTGEVRKQIRRKWGKRSSWRDIASCGGSEEGKVLACTMGCGTSPWVTSHCLLTVSDKNSGPLSLTLTGQCGLLINFMCDMMHMPLNVCVCSWKIDVAGLFVEHEGKV